MRERLSIEGLATPIIRGQPFYQSYLIVHKDSPFQSLEALKNHRFAFTDPDSNTGALVPHYWLSLMGERPSSFFSQFTYTYSHDNSIMAVARALVDGAAVDGHQWEYYHLRNPQYTRLTRVVKKSERFGNPPLVAAADLAPDQKAAIQHVLLVMHQDPAGKLILDQLLIDRFEIPKEQWYAPVQAMYLKTQASR
jgi:phosphonate transport system substrate-binding protein